MLFNSPEFLLAFLPVTFLGFWLFAHLQAKTEALVWLTAASIFFYGWWRPDYVPLLLLSVAVNYLAGLLIVRHKSGVIFVAGIAANLILLGYFKYLDFGVELAQRAFGTHWSAPGILLPLAISFFTFQQITYLADLRAGAAEPPGILKYTLFVTFFPHLIAGPITHHREMTPQFSEPAMFRFDTERCIVALTVFLVGLFKKTVIADGLALYATPVFNTAAAGGTVSIVEAWLGAVAYTLQLYFDFSGYSDMAIGLGLLFGVALPLNFNSPFKATNIIDYWTRWHMTLTRFLNAYLYNPIVLSLTRRRMAAGKPVLGRTPPRPGTFLIMIAAPTIFTMFLAGIWHGAGYNFLIFGLLHGLYLIVANATRHLKRALGLPAEICGRAGAVGGWLLTFTAVVVAHVFFRADGTPSAVAIVSAMAGAGDSFVLPPSDAYPAWFKALIHDAGGSFGHLPNYWGETEVLAIGLALAVVLLLPNVGQWMRFYQTSLHRKFRASWIEERARWLLVSVWRPSPACGLLVGALAFLALLKIFSSAPTEFLYFAF